MVPRQAFPDVRVGQEVTIEGVKYIATGICGTHDPETLTINPEDSEFELTPLSP